MTWLNQMTWYYVQELLHSNVTMVVEKMPKEVDAAEGDMSTISRKILFCIHKYGVEITKITLARSMTIRSINLKSAWKFFLDSNDAGFLFTFLV